MQDFTLGLEILIASIIAGFGIALGMSAALALTRPHIEMRKKVTYNNLDKKDSE